MFTCVYRVYSPRKRTINRWLGDRDGMETFVLLHFEPDEYITYSKNINKNLKETRKREMRIDRY